MVRASSCSATGMMFLFPGRTTTWPELTCSTASSSSAVDGFIVCPPRTMPCTPSSRNSSLIPAPLLTATTAHVTAGCSESGAGGGRSGDELGLAHGVLGGDLLEQVGDPDLPGPAVEVEGDLDGGADVVGVDVTVPDPVPADHDDGVADRSPSLLEILDAVVAQIAEEHHLVARVAGGELGIGRAPTGASRRPLLRRLGERLAVDHVERGVEEQQVPGAAGVDHAGLLQHRQQIRRRLEGGPTGVASGRARRRRGTPRRPRPHEHRRRWPAPR